MTKRFNSLLAKLTASFIVLVLVVSGMTFFYTFDEAKKALKESVRAELTEAIGIVASQIKGEEVDRMLALKPGDEGSANYTAIVDHLVEMRNYSEVLINFYTLRKNGTETVFIVDDAYPKDYAKIGEAYESPDEEFLNGFDHPTASQEFYTDKWGTFLSGYAPIKDSTGKVVAIVGGDYVADKVMEKQNFLQNTVFAIFGVALIVAAAIIGLISRTIIRDIKKLNVVADKISKGDMDVTVDIRRKDEIGDLAGSFGRMVASLKYMMMEQEETKKK